MSISPQFSLFPESGDQLGSAADVPQFAASERAELGEVFGGEVRQAMLFEIAPDIFGGIEFGRISRERGGINLSPKAFEIFPDESAAVNHGSVPDDQQLAGQLSLEVFQELDDLRAFDGSRVKLEIKIPAGDTADDRKPLPVEIKCQHWGLPARSPSAHPVGFLAQTAFINEDKEAVFFQGFFLRHGQVSCFQRRMAGSSRWMARVVGRWPLQPICPSNRPTWSGWYDKLH